MTERDARVAYVPRRFRPYMSAPRWRAAPLAGRAEPPKRGRAGAAQDGADARGDGILRAHQHSGCGGGVGAGGEGAVLLRRWERGGRRCAGHAARGASLLSLRLLGGGQQHEYPTPYPEENVQHLRSDRRSADGAPTLQQDVIGFGWGQALEKVGAESGQITLQIPLFLLSRNPSSTASDCPVTPETEQLLTVTGASQIICRHALPDMEKYFQSSNETGRLVWKYYGPERTEVNFAVFSFSSRAREDAGYVRPGQNISSVWGYDLYFGGMGILV
ncbi:hypothetical protein BC826DRAFT_1177735 [Russula brevipes]|nr:hypothetical protein BC826DRAFT_1177735 [Russula brevipes]